MITMFIVLIMLIFISSGVREGLQWKSENKIFLNLTLKDWFSITTSLVIAITILTTPILLVGKILYIMMLALYIWFAELLYTKDEIDLKLFIIDYHAIRALEFSIPFIMFLVGGMNFFTLSAWWFVGNWFYKRVMNKALWGSFKHRMTMKVYWMFNKPFPYSDKYYDYSLLLPLLYFMGKFL